MNLPAKQDRFLLFVSLILAVFTYSYINHLVNESIAKYDDPSYRLIKLTAKTVPVKARFSSEPPTGYRLVKERVKITPAYITLIGPEALLEDTDYAETAILDIGQINRKVTKAMPLESIAGIALRGEPHIVEVSVPIEKMDINL